MDTPLLPRYGTGALSDVVPSLLAGLGVPGMTNRLGLPEANRVCLLLIDGLGSELLREHADHAPFLTSLASDSEPITAGFPATTATSIAGIGTGVTPGEHGIVGYCFAIPGGELINTLGWRSHGSGEHTDLRKVFPPEQAQPHPTLFERAADAGVTVRQAVDHQLRESGLTRAVMRGGTFDGVYALGDLAATVLETLATNTRVFCYAYHADLDLVGHIRGPASDAWRLQLAHADHLAATIARGLPDDAVLAVTGDHGMVRVAHSERVDFDTSPTLREGVRMLGGEARARHVYTTRDATDDVRAAWETVLGDRAWIVTRDEAVAEGWFGPHVTDDAYGRIGDLVVAATGTTVITRSNVEPRLSRMRGHHGSLTADEQLVPLLATRRT